MAAKNTADNLRNVIGSITNTSTPYNPTNVYNRGKRKTKKSLKRTNYDVNLYDFPGDDIFQKDGEIEGKCLKLLGRGSIVIVEDFSAGQVFVEIAELALMFLNPKPNPGEISNAMTFFKRIGRKQVFVRHQHSSSFRYDASGIKDLCGKDCKTLYVVLNSKFANDKSSVSVTQSNLTDTPLAISDDSDYVPDDSLNDYQPQENTSSSFTYSFKRQDTSSSDNTIESFLKSKDLLNRKVYEHSDKNTDVMTSLILLSYYKDFCNVMEMVLKDKKGTASDIEHAIGQAGIDVMRRTGFHNFTKMFINQVLLLLKNDDTILWGFALEDLVDELKIKKSDDVVDIMNIVFQSLKSLDTEIWSERFFKKLFKSALMKEYYSENFNDSQELRDSPTCYIDISDRCHTLEDVFVKFTTGKPVEVPSEYKENVKEGEIWRRQFFQECPPVLVLCLRWKFKKKHFLESSEKISLSVIEDSKSTNRKSYHLGALVISNGSITYLLINCRKIGKWNIYSNGYLYCVDMTEELLNKFYSLPDAKLGDENKLFESTWPVFIEKGHECRKVIKPDFLRRFLFPWKQDQRLSERKAATVELVIVSDSIVGNREPLTVEQMVERRLRNIYGQFKLKQKMQGYARRAMFDKRRGVSLGNDVSSLHMIFYGNPGTGKTMAARCMAGVFKDLGFINEEKFIEVQRSDLVADHIGGTAQKTEKVIKRAEGGVLFVDEAYRLCSASERDYGREAMETIMDKMNANVNPKIKNPIFIFAGYKKEMEEQFLTINPGLPRRLNKTKVTFENFKPNELADITKKKLIDQKRKFPHDIDEILCNCFKSVPAEVVAKTNAALCTDVIEFIQVRQESRLQVDCCLSELAKFTIDDVNLGISDFLKSPITFCDQLSVNYQLSVDAETQTETQTEDKETTTDDLPPFSNHEDHFSAANVSTPEVSQPQINCAIEITDSSDKEVKNSPEVNHQKINCPPEITGSLGALAERSSKVNIPPEVILNIPGFSPIVSTPPPSLASFNQDEFV